MIHFKPNKPLKRILTQFIGVSILFFVSLFILFPLPHPLFNKEFSKSLLDQDNKLIQVQISKDEQWRIPFLNNHISEKYSKALVEYEDHRFYYHLGIDFLSIIRAVYSNLKASRVISGASTISMQVIRLSQDHPPRNFKQKLVEAWWALLLELKYSKKEILQFYAQHAPMGGNIIGLESACFKYFGRANGSLSWAEAALLAVLPNNPSYLQINRNRQKLLNKRNALLKSLLAKKIIEEVDYRLALKEDLPEDLYSLPNYAPHFLVKNTSESSADLFHSTIDLKLQIKAQDQVNRYQQFLQSLNIHSVAAIIIDNHSYEVKAYIGNATRSDSSLQFRYVDFANAPRSSGSILKPFLYAQMLDGGLLLPKQLIPDIPTRYKGFFPQNYSKEYLGAVPADLALARSLNIPAVRMLDEYGVPLFYNYLKKLGMSTLHREAGGYGLSLILGGAEAKLIDITMMYTHFAKSLLEKDSTLISPRAAYLTLEALLEANRPGLEIHWQNFSSSHKIAFKTGTSYGHRDAWAVGLTPDYTIGVLVGNADGEGKPEIIGLQTAAPLLFNLFNLTPKIKQQNWFKLDPIQKNELVTCHHSGFLASAHCPQKDTILVATDNIKKGPCPFHHIVHLDSSSQYQVNSSCYDPNQMITTPQFTLPNLQEHYFKKSNPNYQLEKPWAPFCSANLEPQNPMTFIYPSSHTSIYLPKDSDTLRHPSIFEASHKNSKAIIHWHLDEQYLGQSEFNHKMAIKSSAGKHLITLVDNEGNKLSRSFKILSSEE